MELIFSNYNYNLKDVFSLHNNATGRELASVNNVGTLLCQMPSTS